MSHGGRVRSIRASPPSGTWTRGEAAWHGRCYPRHTHVEFVAFLNAIDKKYKRR